MISVPIIKLELYDIHRNKSYATDNLFDFLIIEILYLEKVIKIKLALVVLLDA